MKKDYTKICLNPLSNQGHSIDHVYKLALENMLGLNPLSNQGHSILFKNDFNYNEDI